MVKKHILKRIIFTLTLLSTFQISYTQEISDWRPENRTGVSAEKGLLKSWPESGPKLLWANEKLAKGNSSVSFGNNKIYTTGTEDGNDILFALDMSGEILWKKVMGRAWNESYPESRATPTVQGDRVYTCSGYGDLACFNGTSGNIIWSVKASEENNGTYDSWGIAEALLIDGDNIYFSPGGNETTTIALNKNTGKVIWKSKSIQDKPAYVSPVLANYAGIKMLINVSLNHVYSINVSNGEILWKMRHLNPRNERDNILCVTPLFKDGKVYVTAGYDVGSYQLKINDDGKSFKLIWSDKVLDVHHGGVVLVDGYIYGSNWENNSDGNWCCLDWETGKNMWEEAWNCKGSIIAADGMLYIYDEKRGNVGLVRPDPEKFDLVSSFKVTKGSSGPFWAHPVIHNGILYIRHTNALMAYDIKAR